MNRRLKIALWGLAGVVLLAVPATSQDTSRSITSAILQGRAWIFTTLQTFGAGLTTGTIYDSGAAGPAIVVAGAQVEAAALDGGTFDFLDLAADLALPDPSVAPTVGASAAGGACTNAAGQKWKFAVIWMNASGTTARGTESAEMISTGTNRYFPITRPTIPSDATAWAPVYAKLSESYSTWRRCSNDGEDGSDPITPAATATANCVCSSTAVIGTNTTGNLTIGSVLDGELRASGRAFAEFYDTDNPVVTPGKYRLKFAGSAPTWSPDAGVTSLPVALVTGQTRRVCAVGCPYATIFDAVASITDAAQDKRYVIYVEAGEYGGGTLSDWTTLVGEGGTATKIGGEIFIPDDFNEIGIFGVYVTDHSGVYCAGVNAGAGTSRLYLMSNILGSPETYTENPPIDTFWGCSDTHVFDIANIHQTTWDAANTVGTGAGRYIANGSTYNVRPLASAGPKASAFLVGAGSNFIGNGLTINFDTSNSAADTASVYAASIETSSSTTPLTFILRNSHINIINTRTQWNAIAACVHNQLVSYAAGLGAVLVDLSGTTCNITMASTSGTLAGFYLANQSDADLPVSTYRWTSGEIALSGGANRYTVYVGVGSPAGESFILGPSLIHPATFSIAGSATVSYVSGFMRSADLVAGTGLASEIAIDTGGATREICFFTGGAWTCVSATTVTGPTD